MDTVREDLLSATAPAIECFQGFCLQGSADSTLLSRWWNFSLTYLKLVTLGMIFAFLIAGLTETFLFPPEVRINWSQRGLKGSLRGLMIGPVMNLCSACIVPVSSAFRRRGAGIETTIAIVQGSSTLNLPALIMAILVFAPMLSGSRIGLSVVGALLLGPLVAFLAGERKQPPVEPIPEPILPDSVQASWREVLTKGLRDWMRSAVGYLIRLGPIMVVAGFASGLALQWVSPATVETFLGDNLLGVVSAATLGILINVPLLFEIPLVAALLLVGMGTAPAATLLFVAAAGGPITFWGLAKVMPKRAVVTFATATWSLGAIAGLSLLLLGPLIAGDGTTLVRLDGDPAATCPACILREAILEADDGTTIQIPPGIYTLTEGELVIDKDITLVGAGYKDTIIEAAETMDTATNRVMRIPFGSNVTISGMTIRHGVVTSTEARHVVFPATVGGIVTIRREFGGGIHIHGALQLIDVVISGNHAGGGGGIFNGGTLTLTNTAIADNIADAEGGGIFNGGNLSVEGGIFRGNKANSGGGISNWGNVTMTRTTLTGNRSHIGGGAMHNTSVGFFELDSSTISSNRSGGGGGGIRNMGRLTIANSTVSDNSAQFGAGIQNWNRLMVVNSTLSGNHAKREGGGINIKLPAAPPQTELRGTIVANNEASTAPDCSGLITSLGHNLLGSSEGCSYVAALGDLVGTPLRPIDAKLAPLSNNGGSTKTRALLPGSPAIDSGTRGLTSGSDQRGFARPWGKAHDIGAYELTN
ncbi:MAG: permease [Chloroflexi bacterium]|nr:permease [Chloroflexota bacterium]